MKTAKLAVIILLAAFVLLAPGAQRAEANLAQMHIFNVGVNLGWAAAYVSLYGDNAPAQQAYIDGCMARAAAHVQAAASLFQEPYRTMRKRSGTDRAIIARINNYRRYTARQSRTHRAGYLTGLWGGYRQGFQTTFTSSRPDAVHYQPNCDLYTLDAGYHFGRAQIFSSLSTKRGRSAQNGALASMRQAVFNGLRIAMDADPPKPGVRKVCCSFGPREAWDSAMIFKANSPPSVFERQLPVLQGITRNSALRPEQCGGTPLGCYHIVGIWHWFNGRRVHICKNGTYTEYSGTRVVNTGRWRCIDSRKKIVRLRWNKGGWIDTLTINANGNSLSGKNQHGTKVTGRKTTGTPNCSQTGGGGSGKVTMEHGTNRRGRDYKSFWLDRADPNLCAQACTNDPKCKAYTYVVPGYQGKKAKCWLKNQVPKTTREKCCVSGVKQ